MKENPHITISETDKGHKTIICSTQTLKRKRDEFIAKQVGNNVYIPMGKPNGCNWQEAFEIHIRQLSKAKVADYNFMAKRLNVIFIKDKQNGLDVPKYGTLRPQAYQMSKMEIAVKSHKGSVYPIRPIIAAPAAMGDTLQEFYLRRISRLFERGVHDSDQDTDCMVNRILHNQHILKDSVTLRDELCNTTIPNGHAVFSIDFSDMYTNINLDTAMQVIYEKFDTHIKNTTSITKDDFVFTLRKLLHLNEHFSADLRIYKQNKGLPMGGKLSYALSEIVTTQGLFAAIRAAVGMNIKISYIAKYVDDIIIIMDNTSPTYYNGTSCTNIEVITKLIESNIPGMPVTHEVESTGPDGIPYILYLNMIVSRTRIDATNRQQMVTRWAAQSYASGRIVNAWSAHSRQTKTAIVKETFRTAIKVSSPTQVDISISTTWQRLLNNGYRSDMLAIILKEVCTDENVNFRDSHEFVRSAAHVAADTDASGANREAEYSEVAHSATTSTAAHTSSVPGSNVICVAPRSGSDNDHTTQAVAHRTPSDEIRTGVLISNAANGSNAPASSTGTPNALARSRRRVICTICNKALFTWNNETQHRICRFRVFDRKTRLQYETIDITDSTNMDIQSPPKANVTLVTPQVASTRDTHCNQNSRTITASIGTQTVPTKGRSIIRSLPEVGIRHILANNNTETQYIKYISIPYVSELFENAQKIISEHGSSCTLMHKMHKNSLFGSIKDALPITHTAMVTFCVKCFTCDSDIFFNATEVTVSQKIKQLSSCNNTSDNATHMIQWDRPRIVFKHTTANKASKVLNLIWDCVSATGTDGHFAPYVRATKWITPELQKAILGNFYNGRENANNC